MAWPLPDRCVLGILARRPDPGLVKTRLADSLGDEGAAAAHEAMLLDLAEIWGSSSVLADGGRRVLAYSPADAGPWFDERVASTWSLVPQGDGDLGTRMRAFFDGEFADGAERVVLIGSDAPTLDPSLVVSAFLCLEGRDLVLGPAADGGYYLVGCRGLTAPIFEGVDWGSEQVLSQTIGRLQGMSTTLSVLPPWYDVDRPEDWRALRGHIAAMRRAGLDPRLPRVEALLK